ncbi:MAG: hypothetical protein J6O49_13595 [Bacteroidaceae bacterium]|nr:hypothetical protein [Bacteroidaceae bacterium]
MKKVYLILAALMLICLAPMPYGYYILVRFVAMVVFGFMAYRYYVSHKAIAAVVFGVLALLFQPIYKIALGRATWNVIDVLVAGLLVGLYILEKRMEKKATVGYQQLPPQDQIKLEDNKIEFKLDGRLSPKELVYVASEEDKALTELFETHPEVLEGWGQMIGFQIVFLPLLMKRLKDKRVLQYRAPYLNDVELSEITIGNNFLLQYLENPADKERIRQAFIRTEDIHRGDDGKDKARNRFYPLSSTSGEPLADQLHRIGKQISVEKARYDRYLESKDQSFNDWGDAGDNEPPAESGFNSQSEDENTDDLMEEIRERIAKLRQRGIAEYILEQLIHPDNRLSRMVITKDWRIVLPDYNNMEIKMEPLVKAVYLLFLRHPEGIVFKHLPDYRQELTNIYSKLRPLSQSNKAIQSIEDVTNPLLNSINEKCARIRGAFLGEFDDYMAKYYYIDGPRGEAKKIALPRDFVVWE